MNSDDIVWLSADDVIQIHEAIFYPSRAPGERSDRPVDGPVSNVPNHFNYGGYELDVVLIASAYAHDIARAHAFHDGNKRTALQTLLAYLDDCGLELAVPNDDTLVPIMVAVAAGEMNAHELYDAIVNFVRVKN